MWKFLSQLFQRRVYVAKYGPNSRFIILFPQHLTSADIQKMKDQLEIWLKSDSRFLVMSNADNLKLIVLNEQI